jgi:hypothetical protein
MNRLIDLAGQTFGRWRVLGLADERSKRGHARWLCRCIDGEEKVVRGDSLRNGQSKSCGCLKREEVSARMQGKVKHGHARSRKYGGPSRAYVCWANMLQRCGNERHPRFPDYGGRGIGFDPAYRNFQNWHGHIGDPPIDKTLDRPNNDRGYMEKNMRWATRREQQRNQRKRKRNRWREGRW